MQSFILLYNFKVYMYIYTCIREKLYIKVLTVVFHGW